jgi:hypothetical protein
MRASQRRCAARSLVRRRAHNCRDRDVWQCSVRGADQPRRLQSPLLTTAINRISQGIGSSVVVGGSRNSTATRPPGDHLSLTRAPGSKFWGIPPDARLPPKFHHKRGR